MRTSPVILIASLLLAGPLTADTFTVDTNGSASDGCDEAPDPQICDTQTSCQAARTNDCTINAAIQSANNLSDADEIAFDLASITLDGNLLAILYPVTIGPDSPPRVDLNGAGTNSGLVLDEMAAGSTIRNLVIRNMSGNCLLYTSPSPRD